MLPEDLERLVLWVQAYLLFQYVLWRNVYITKFFEDVCYKNT